MKLTPLGILSAVIICLVSSSAAAASTRTADFLRLQPPAAGTPGQPVRPNRQVPLALALPLRNAAELTQTLSDLYDPNSPRYHQFLTAKQFTERYCPTEQEYAAVATLARQLGMQVTATHPNRMILDVTAPAAAMEEALGTKLQAWTARDGHEFVAPSSAAALPINLAQHLSGVIGLDDTEVLHTYNHKVDAATAHALQPYQVGSGPGGGLTPSDIRAAYNLSGLSLTGTGQTIALFELDGYIPADIALYESQYGLPNAAVQNIMVDGFTGTAGSSADEVTLDIELALAVAPNAKILVYEGPQTGQAVVDVYNKIATDNLAKEVSTSWGLAELKIGSGVRNAENAIFQQMASQGQSIFAASGDAGAYDDGTNLSVDDPASQPFATGVGGTQLFVNADHTYRTESTWNHGTKTSGAGGGGMSAVWAKPAYQAGLGSGVRSTGSVRDVPDVCLNSDPFTAYSIARNGGWGLFGGTSCAAPLWAAFTALVNQQKALNGTPPLGFANPALYDIGRGAHYAAAFHDVADGSSNLQYAAVPGYDDATGWGSLNGANLLTALSPAQPLTMSGDPVITVRRGGATVQWSTNKPANSVIHLGTDPGHLTATGTFGSLSITHVISIGGLPRQKTYYLTVESNLGSAKVVSKVLSFKAM